jgi:hypothetical protein
MLRHISQLQVDGFSITATKKGEEAQILMKGFATSDESNFSAAKLRRAVKKSPLLGSIRKRRSR